MTNQPQITELQNWGQKLAQLRKTANLRQEDLAIKSGVSIGVLRRVESGTNVRFNDVLRLLAALGKLSDVSEALTTSFEPAHRIRLNTPTKNSSDWRVLLTGAQANRAREKAVQSLLALPNAERIIHYELANGAIGFALACARVFNITKEPRLREKAISYLDRAEHLAEAAPTITPSLFGGLTGLAWAASLAQSELGLPASPFEFEQQVGAAALAYVQSETCTRNLDLVYGLSGIGLYACQYPDSTTHLQLINAILAKLTERFEVKFTGSGAWRTDSEHLGYDDRPRFPKGAFNLGLSHGNGAILAFMATCQSLKLLSPAHSLLLNQGISWYKAQREIPMGEIFASFAYLAEEPEGLPARFAWCYGDLGSYMALIQSCPLGAARQSFAVNLVKSRLRRNVDSLKFYDAGLCHGLAGSVAFLAQAAYQTQHNPLWRIAAQDAKSLESTCTFAVSPLGWNPEQVKPSAGFMSGQSGAALALAEATTDQVSPWHALWGFSTPPKGLTAPRQFS